MVPVGERAAGVGCREVVTSQSCCSAARPAVDVAAVRVEDDHVPRAEVIRVPALAGVPGKLAEVPEVGGPVVVVVVVADRRAQPVHEPAPGWAEAVGVGSVAAPRDRRCRPGSRRCPRASRPGRRSPRRLRPRIPRCPPRQSGPPLEEPMRWPADPRTRQRSHSAWGWGPLDPRSPARCSRARIATIAGTASRRRSSSPLPPVAAGGLAGCCRARLGREGGSRRCWPGIPTVPSSWRRHHHERRGKRGAVATRRPMVISSTMPFTSRTRSRPPDR